MNEFNCSHKKVRGIHPIAVGYYWRRLSLKCGNSFDTDKLATYFSLIQLRVGVPGGCETIIHTCRRFAFNTPNDHIVVKLDFSNAFNCLHRDSMLESFKQSVPEIYSFCLLSYGNDSVLNYRSRQILSENIQQGNELGTNLLYCLRNYNFKGHGGLGRLNIRTIITLKVIKLQTIEL